MRITPEVVRSSGIFRPGLAPNAMRQATISISPANSESLSVSFTFCVRATTSGETTMPLSENRNAARQSTWRLMVCRNAPNAAIIATIRSDTLRAVCTGNCAPYTRSGIASIDPPLPVSPSERPTSAPNPIRAGSNGIMTH